jgi:hypothetical protein
MGMSTPLLMGRTPNVSSAFKFLCLRIPLCRSIVLPGPLASVSTLGFLLVALVLALAVFLLVGFRLVGWL